MRSCSSVGTTLRYPRLLFCQVLFGFQNALGACCYSEPRNDWSFWYHIFAFIEQRTGYELSSNREDPATIGSLQNSKEDTFPQPAVAAHHSPSRRTLELVGSGKFYRSDCATEANERDTVGIRSSKSRGGKRGAII